MPVTTTSPEAAAHAERTRQLVESLHRGPRSAPLALAKRHSNLFRDRQAGARRRLDLGAFDQVLAVDTTAGQVQAEGSTCLDTLVAATLPHGVMPAVVPQLKGITLGGAAAGVGIEATSFRHGLLHETLVDFDVLLPGGDLVHCTPHNVHRELFFGFPNSYGTLGYALRLTQRTQPVRRFVGVRHLRFGTAAAFFAELAAQFAGGADFVDGVAFARDTLVLSVARFEEEAPWLSDYGAGRIYYRSLLERDEDHLRTADYLWRWDTDWFWCSRRLGLQHPWVRPLLGRLLGRERLNSRTYTRLMRLDARWGLSRGWDALRGLHAESVIQDVDIPLAQAAEFLDFLLREVGILPIWLCPLRASAQRFTLYPLQPGGLYVNFGFWDTLRSREPRAPGEVNRRIEHEVMRLGGIKSLYADSYFTPAEFAQAYAMPRYAELKARYDPEGHALTLYEKCVQRR